MVKAINVPLPYQPREAFLPFHERKQRWACLVAHRRAGKTVAAVNDQIKGAVFCQTHNPLFGYIAPFRAQAKSVAWDYLKRYSEPLQLKVYESDLIVTLKNAGPSKQAELRLFGADNPDAIRGLGFDNLTMDEYGDFRPSIWGAVLRPALADKSGSAVFMGTPKGKNQFWDIHDRAQTDPDWFSLVLRASQSRILSGTEIADMRRTQTDDQYLQEMECSFEAAILGAFYGSEMRQLGESGRFTSVAYDPSLPTYTAWDLGFRDDTAIWWYQVVRSEIHVIDFYSISGAAIHDICKVVSQKPYHYGRHFLPHDARAKTLASGGKSIIEQVAEHLGLSTLSIVPNLSVQDGIQAVRKALPLCWFDGAACKDGIEALRQYQREFDEDKKAFRQAPKHDWTSHAADAFRMAAISYTEEQPQMRTFPERALIVGPGNKATLEDMWAATKRAVRRQRI
jgi:phage terminase large subunit